MAKIFKISGYFIDPNGDYIEGDILIDIKNSIDAISRHLVVEERDIGEWDDNSILNSYFVPKEKCEVYFKE